MHITYLIAFPFPNWGTLNQQSFSLLFQGHKVTKLESFCGFIRILKTEVFDRKFLFNVCSKKLLNLLAFLCDREQDPPLEGSLIFLMLLP